MASVNITLKGTLADLDYFCTYHKYEENIEDPTDPEKTIPNPQTKVEFLDAKVKSFVNESAKAGKAMEVDVAKRVTLDSYSPSF